MLSNSAVLRVERLSKSFGGIHSLQGVGLSIRRDEVVGLIGPNGAGKTTLLNVIAGVYKPDSGRIYLEDKEITGYPPHKVARWGISRSFQVPRILRRLTVEENVRSAMLRSRSHWSYELSRELLEVFNLTSMLDEPAKNLSGGQQKLLDVIRALLPNSKVVLLDEPTGGVHPDMISTLLGMLRELNRRQGRAMIIIEHNIPVISEISDRVLVMNEGMIIAEGRIDEVLDSPAVIEAYLGG